MGQKRDLDALLGDDTNKFGALEESSLTGAQGSSVHQENDEGWQTVTRKEKRSKKNKKQKLQDPNRPSTISSSPNARLQNFLKIRDFQSLVLYLLADGPAPTWAAISNRTQMQKAVVLMVPGLEADMFNGQLPLSESAEEMKNGETKPSRKVRKAYSGIQPDDYYPSKLDQNRLPEALRPLAAIFTQRWPLRAPGDDKIGLIFSSSRAFLSSPLPKTQDEKKLKGPKPVQSSNWPDKQTPVTTFIMTQEELELNEYVVHPSVYKSEAELEAALERRKQSKSLPSDGWLDTTTSPKDGGGSLEDHAADGKAIENPTDLDLTGGKTVISIDCEMCQTYDKQFELTRISVIGWDGSVILDELVQPPNTITDYLTQYSGITKEMLEPVTTTLEDIQVKLKDMIDHDTVIVGHSLNSDFNALKMTHPFIIDTSVLYPHPQGPPFKSSLKFLAKKYLDREIQNKGPQGHNSVEDALAVLDLVKLKCKKGEQWVSHSNDEPLYRRISRSPRSSSVHVDEETEQVLMKTMHVDWDDSRNNYGAYATKSVKCMTDLQVVETITAAISTESEDIPGGADFIWGRLRGLEQARGWRTRPWDRTPDREGGDPSDAPTAANSDPSTAQLGKAVDETVKAISAIYASLPAHTTFIVYTGACDQREFHRLRQQHTQFKREYKVKKWDELSVRWTEHEEKALRSECQRAREALGFVTVKPASQRES
ncbi:hypothetical protein BT63DRAFT_419848 [Microthyrium microscopicum]|uniref:Exonuclease domain-containing protein n=1 Tax=Microthyrium microscopicum TaxID=703497 RepID=A0A6A6US28_9PEZI|nr:hypothetical protein BT63DRAFT_419848 [Microthyrium microscopicum]